MPGTKAGGMKTAATLKAKYGKDYYVKIGREGGKLGHTGGFHDRELARRAGAKGGKISKRTKVIHESDDLWPEVFNVAPIPKKSLWQRIIRSK